MKRFRSHLKKNIFRGVIASIPLVLLYFVVRFLYLHIDQRIVSLIDELIGFRIPGLGLAIFFIVLYMIGIIAGNVMGAWLIERLERLIKKGPIIRTTYSVGKQISGTLSLPEKHIFKRAVLVDYLKPGIKTLGFVTGEIIEKATGEKMLKVFIPTPPNPTSGTMVIVKTAEARDPGWSIEESVKTVISGGIIGPSEIA